MQIRHSPELIYVERQYCAIDRKCRCGNEQVVCADCLTTCLQFSPNACMMTRNFQIDWDDRKQIQDEIDELSVFCSPALAFWPDEHRAAVRWQ